LLEGKYLYCYGTCRWQNSIGFVEIGRGTYLSLSEDEIWRLFVQLCIEISHIHSKPLIHRDLKTQNVFLSGKERTTFNYYLLMLIRVVLVLR
jgi:serine/threonine protein kinase